MASTDRHFAAPIHHEERSPWETRRVCERNQKVGQLVCLHRQAARRSYVVSLGAGIHVGWHRFVGTSVAAMSMIFQLQASMNTHSSVVTILTTWY